MNRIAVTALLLCAFPLAAQENDLRSPVSGAARSPEHSPLVRIYAMAMLYSFAEPGSSVWMRDLLQPRENRSVRIYQVSGDGDRPNPLGDVEAEVEALLAEIIAVGGEPQVIRVATEIHQLL